MRTEMEKFLGLEVGLLLGVHRMKGWEKVHSMSAALGLASASLFPLSSSTWFIVVTMHTQVQPQHCLCTSVHAHSSSGPQITTAESVSQLKSPEKWVAWLTHFLIQGHRSQSPEWAINHLLWNQLSMPGALSHGRGWAPVCRCGGGSCRWVGKWWSFSKNSSLCSGGSFFLEPTLPAPLRPFSTWQGILLQEGDQTFVESLPSSYSQLQQPLFMLL